MEEQFRSDRGRLRYLLQEHPEWSIPEYAMHLKRSESFVKKWKKRLQEAFPGDDSILWGQSRARKNPPPSMSPRVEERILDIRDHPPKNLKRVPGPKAIIYYLKDDPILKHLPWVHLPTSTRTVWQRLKDNDRIAKHQQPEPEPLERPEPMQSWALDYKDVSSVRPQEDGKQMHAVETLNIVDEGTSILLDAQVRQDYNAETTVETLAAIFKAKGKPEQVRFDNDPRFVSSWSADKFPSAFMRFCLCLGVRLEISPPHQPWKNPFVERFNGSYKRECLNIYRPETLHSAQEVTDVYREHYNTERPHQGLSCQNQPPLVAFPDLPPCPAVADLINPDAWLKSIDGQIFTRRINRNGTVQVDTYSYYIQQKLKGQIVSLKVDAQGGQFQVYVNGMFFKSLPIKGLVGRAMTFDDYVAYIAEQARSEERRLHLKRSAFRRAA